MLSSPLSSYYSLTTLSRIRCPSFLLPLSFPRSRTGGPIPAPPLRGMKGGNNQAQQKRRENLCACLPTIYLIL